MALFGKRQGSLTAVLVGGVAIACVIDVPPLMRQRFPREIIEEVVEKYGVENVRIDATVLNSVDATARKYSPISSYEAGEHPRYLLLNVRDIWIDGPPVCVTQPQGAVLLEASHPRQRRSFQYHGYTPRQRAFLRRCDFSMRLIDTSTTNRE